MTREEAISHIKYSIKAYQNLIENDGRSGEVIGKDIKGEWKSEKTLADAYMKMIESLKMAIMALEQEPILDKISAEMREEMLSHSGTGEEVIQAYADGLKKGLEIIDKYKAESEEK